MELVYDTTVFLFALHSVVGSLTMHCGGTCEGGKKDVWSMKIIPLDRFAESYFSRPETLY